MASCYSVGVYNCLVVYLEGGYKEVKTILNKNVEYVIEHNVERIHLLELVAPKISEIKRYINGVSKNADFVLIELIEGDVIKPNR